MKDHDARPRRRAHVTAGVFLVLASLTAPVLAADRSDHDEPSDKPYWRTNLFRRVVSDQKFLVTQWWPKEFRRTSFSIPLVGAFAAAYASSHNASDPGVDLTTGHRIDSNTGVAGNHYASLFTRGGNGAPIAAALAVTYFASRHRENDRLAGTASLAGEALLDAGIYIQVLKSAFARVRPNATEQGKFFEYGAKDNGSFPSGHAFGAFSVATVFAERYRAHRWAPWLAYGTAGLIGASRAVLGRHFPSDIVAGAVLGNSIGHAVVARSEEAGDEERTRRPQVVPVTGPDGRGLGVGLAWSR